MTEQGLPHYPNPETELPQYPNPEQELPQYTSPEYAGAHYAHYQPNNGRMPGVVRAARVISFLTAGLGFVLTVLVGMRFGAESAGGMTFGFLFAWIIAIFAFQFGSGGRGVRTTVITLSIIEAVIGLGGMASMQPPGPLGIIVGILTACLMGGQSAARWFNRPR
ncbi:hypothetical protein [Nocardia sp. XZ_19_385]|uniref:hypothetical protein n=1 Tax=Nocardia sp. XZ_19_385 TaxID=2769488 RepID=UPI00188E02C9|nr:hypothetical protein [Nocardia sp. XZ_19_385]